MFTAEVTVRNKVGLHARPAALFVSEAKKHECKIRVSANGRTADAKSILAVLALGVQCGQTITITTEGEGDEEALRSLVALFENFPENG